MIIGSIEYVMCIVHVAIHLAPLLLAEPTTPAILVLDLPWKPSKLKED